MTKTPLLLVLQISTEAKMPRKGGASIHFMEHVTVPFKSAKKDALKVRKHQRMHIHARTMLSGCAGQGQRSQVAGLTLRQVTCCHLRRAPPIGGAVRAV